MTTFDPTAARARLGVMAQIEAEGMPRTHVRDVFRDCAIALRALSAENERLRAEIAAAYRAGAEAMREAVEQDAAP